METLLVSKETQLMQNAASTDETRYNLCGVYSNKTHLYATNGNIAVIRRKNETEVLPENCLMQFNTAKQAKVKNATNVNELFISTGERFDERFIGQNPKNVLTVVKDIQYPDMTIVINEAKDRLSENSYTITLDANLLLRLADVLSPKQSREKNRQEVTLTIPTDGVGSIVIEGRQKDAFGILMPMKKQESPSIVNEVLKD